MSASDSVDRRSAPAAFRPINAARAFQEVVDQITRAIRAGVYPPGSRLPPIEELARSMQVSRPTVVDAVRVLTKAGVVKTRRGPTGGVTVVTAIIPARILRLSSDRRTQAFAAVLEARRPVEVALARLAAERATEDDLAELRRAVDLLDESRDDVAAWLQADSLFHHAMGRAAGSPLLAHYQQEIHEEMCLLVEDAKHRDLFYSVDFVLDAHTKTLAAIESGDPDRAEQAMNDHLGTLEALRERDIPSEDDGRPLRRRRSLVTGQPG